MPGPSAPPCSNLVPIVLALGIFAWPGCSAPVREVAVGMQVPAAAGAVACVDPVAARIGALVLRDGGNAVDAAVATAFALAVTWPEAGNLGGGGFLLLRQADGAATFIDYREMAPAAASKDMFLDANGEVDRYHVRLGYRPVGVPGTVAGLWLAHERYGRLPWARLLAPAIALAAEGVTVRPALARSIAEAAAELALDAEAARIFLRADGAAPPAGERLVQSDLAATLRSIADEGADAFYRGAVAQRLVAASRAQGGRLTAADLAGYRALARDPLRGSYRGLEIIAGPPPTSGGQVLLESLQQLQGFAMSELAAGSPAELHLLAEVLRRSFLDRARHLADADFVAVDVASLIDEANAARWRANIDPHHASRSDAIAGDLDGTLPPEGGHTTHFSVIDADGNAVTNTYTLEEAWGAKVVAPGTGFVLNNEMHDFNVTPGRSTRSGRVGTRPNEIAPCKRMLSSMCPVIVCRDGRPYLIAGSPGGRTIPASVLRVLTGVIDHGLSLREAIDLPRIHHGLYPDRIAHERSLPEATRAALIAMGHALHQEDTQGDCHAIGVDAATGQYLAVADRRRDGAAAAVIDDP